jgi:hypothetical protein
LGLLNGGGLNAETYQLSPAMVWGVKIQEGILRAIKGRLKWHQQLASGQAKAILRMRFGSSLPDAPHLFFPGGISGLNFSYKA